MSAQPLSREAAMETFRDLVRQHGLNWTPRMPSEAYDKLKACYQVLTEKDMRKALASKAEAPH